MIKIWTLGNTGLRSADRALEGLRAYALSPLVGDIHGDNEVKLERVLYDAGLIENFNPSSDGTYGRKWRLAWCRNGFIYAKAKPNDPFSQSEIGQADAITPLGRRYIEVDTLEANQDLFLRQMIMPLYLVGEDKYYFPFDWKGNDGKYFSPLLWTLRVLLALEKATGQAAIRFEEFALHVQTSDPTHDIDSVIEKILELRHRRSQSTAKKIFDKREYEKYGLDYSGKANNFKEYGDANLRYLRQTGIFARNGRGIAIRSECHSLAQLIIKTDYSSLSLLDRLNILYNVPSLPTDDAIGAKQVLNDMVAVFKAKGLSFDLAGLDMSDAVAMNHARMAMQAVLDKTNEEEFALRQCKEWKEISAYMRLIISNEQQDEDFDISVPKESRSAYLEWTIWRSLLAIDSLINKAAEVRSFRIDQDMMPVNTAPGGKPDLLAEYIDSFIVGEVTLSTSSMQEAMEGEPVRRHVADRAVSTSKHVYGMFIANKIDTNTAETFRRMVWYLPNDEPIDLIIVPLTLEQYNKVFCYMFEKGIATPDRLVKLIWNCAFGCKDLTALQWKVRINTTVENFIRGNLETYDI